MNIGILGSGDVGKMLGAGFVSRGDSVKIGSREPGKLAEWVKKNGARASAGTFAEAAEFGEVVVVATLWSGTESAIKMAGADKMKGKVVIDATNPLKYVDGRPAGLAVGFSDSGGEQLQRWIPGGRVVKCFNTVGNAHMYKPDFPGGPPDMFICGNDEAAKGTVAKVCKDFGWGVVDVGGIEGARLLEPMCILWVSYGMKTGTWNHAFKLLRK